MANLRADNLTGTGGRNAIDGSVFFNERYTRLELDGSSDLAFGTGDFTIEMWIKIDNGTNTNTIYDSRPSGSNGAQVALFYSGGSNGVLFAHGGTVRITGTVDVGADQAWHHIALTRASGSTKLFVDGVQDGSTYSSDTTDYLNPSNKPRIGASGGSTDLSSDGYFRGYISNVRVNKGSALYTAAFTPPTEKLTAVDGTVLLCCQDSDDPTQEATGKTITAVGGSFQTGDSNILTNGDFSQGTTGFVGDSGASISESGGVMTVTNGGGDNLYALKQNGCLRIGGKYRCTATVTPTFASGNPVFRVRFGGDAVSFTQQESTMSTGVAVRIDTGEKVADGTDFEIGSGTSSGITQFTITDLVVTAIDPPKAPKVLPLVGVDEGVTFGGETKHNTQGYMYFPTGDTSQRGRGRGVYMLGYSNPSGGEQSGMEYFDIQSTGNAIKFGDLSTTYYTLGSGSSATRGVWCGGYDGASSPDTDINNIEYITIATTGNTKDFGDRTQVGRAIASTSSETRVCMATAYTGAGVQDTIDYITTASTGNATDFGNLGGARTSMVNASASPTRGIFAGGWQASPVSDAVNTMEYITMASTGNAADFGDLTHKARDGYGGTASSNTRGCIYHSIATPALSNTIDYVTIATTGNAADFGDMTTARDNAGSCSNSIRGVFIAGRKNPSETSTNIMEYLTIATTGNSVDFGDIISITTSAQGAALSDSHGGLS